MKSKKEIALDLTDQLIDEAIKQDVKYKQQCLSMGKGANAQGDSFMVFYLKNLKELIEEI